MGHKKSLKRNLLIALLAGSAALYTMPIYAATSVIANNALPTGGQFFNDGKFVDGTQSGNRLDFEGLGSITKPNDLTMNVHQNADTAVIKWGSFDIGGSATVNFTSDAAKFNTLNFVNSGAASQIYGTINAKGGNIYVVNPAGVQIGNSAQINVGSLYVSNANLDDTALNNFFTNAKVEEVYKFAGKEGVGFTNAELMSLGNINATNVTFEGDGRIVIDSERIKDEAGDAVKNSFRVNTNDAGNVIIGYDAYNEGENKGTYDGKSKDFSNVYVNGSDTATAVKGYMWVEDVDQLQAINTNLSGNYALRNSIDATSKAEAGKSFTSLGTDADNPFKGKFDGIEYNIFGLNITGNDNAGLFGYTDGAIINNVTLVGGSISGGTNVGAVVGSANNTTISNVVNSAAVTGGSNVGGIVGSATATTVENAINTGAVSGSTTNVGGLIGEMTDNSDGKQSQLIGNSYNLGNVGGVDKNDTTDYATNVGGLVGHAVNSTIGDGTNLVYNRLDVTGAYNVGGIVGNMEGSTVQNAENSATVTATGNKTEDYEYHTANGGTHVESVSVNIANVGGIAGTSSGTSTIKDVTNSGDVSSAESTYTQYDSDHTYYTAGNVGGIVGSAVDTNITNATNQENDIRGAHNVGGVAGYFGGSGTVDKGINNGGDIMATGARDADSFVTETVRPKGDANESFIIGNIGGIVGYLDGDGVKVTGSANRGTVHSQDIDDPANVLDTSKAANVGGVVGKIDTDNVASLDALKENAENASVSNSYNTGDVRGYTGVGGVIGMMYNGSVAGAYNTGTVNTTRQVDRSGVSNIDPLNMGGVVGDTTEETNANAIIYDVYNKGQIGDETYNFYARHVGGVVGRLSGTLEKAYNNGDIYNNDTTVGGVVGWWYSGEIKNVFNTGNITVRAATELQVGGIVGASGAEAKKLENAYNLGTIRGYQESKDTTNNAIYVGGIIGRARGGNTNITNVYTMGNLYAATGTYNDNGGNYRRADSGIGAIYGYNGNLDTTRPTLQGANYITPQYSNLFKDLSGQANRNIDYNNRYKSSSYYFVDVDEDPNANDTFSSQNNGNVENATDNNWRIYEGTTPILNAFLPNVEDYFSTNYDSEKIDSIQYGTAYDPLLTIINAKDGVDNLDYNWGELGISGAASLVVNNAGLILNNVDTSAGTGYYAGLLYSQGDLTLNAQQGENVSGDIGFGSEAKLYGSSVKINADGTVTIYGSVTATGEQENSTGNITINAGDVDVYGTLTTGQNTSIAGIANSGSGFEGETNFGNLSNPNEAMVHISDRFAHETTAKGSEENIIITAGTKVDADGNTVTIGDGNVNLYYGNKENGLTTTGGNLTVTATGDVYVDSDLDIGGDLTLKGTGENSEVVLDLTNIGQVQADNGTVTDALTGLHNFMHHFGKGKNDGKHSINLSAEKSGDAKLAVDMWDYEKSEFNLNKFDDTAPDGHTLVDELNNLNIKASVIGDSGDIENSTEARNVTYIWVSSAEQLQGIQDYYTAHKDDVGGTNALTYNYALKGDINASDITDYKAIGGTAGYNGTFDGRGNRIIGLTVVNNDPNSGNAGIFSTIGENGTVKNLNIYSGNFTSTSEDGNAGAVAGVNEGRIENITAFGNTVTANGNAGGIVGVNNGEGTFNPDTSGEGASTLTGNGIYDVESTGSVIAGKDTAIAGGLVGTNAGALGNSFSNSAVTVETGIKLDNTADIGLGGVVGVNTGEVQYVDSLGVTNGGDTGSSNIGGVIGKNNGNLYSAYNESIVSGSDNVGGIIGENVGSYDENNKQWTGGVVSNIVNATSVTGIDDDNIEDKDDTAKNGISDYVGGLVGSNSGSVTNGRNNGTITGTNYVGGMVGDNASGAELTNLVNDSSASITGVEYVGGIAGSNAGTITADEENDNLINRGSITGHTYVGGVAGLNIGTITNTNNDVQLNVNTAVNNGEGAQYFGGVAGQNGDGVNKGVIENATNTNTIEAPNASYVGGITGWNTNTGTLVGMGNSNEGLVIGGSYVGGVIGKNEGAIGSNDSEQVGITNEGIVIATQGGAGGIIGENDAAITNTVMTNKGEVHGNNDNDGSGTGGLIGTNNANGKITASSLINEVTGVVTGVYNVGGIIGINKAEVTGGRDADDTYYKDKIYNNGVINVGTWTDVNSDGEYHFTAQAGSNIGGLIGNNEGSLTAGYNTGAISAVGSENVGGIAGSNSGTIDQVFNTVMTADGTNETITGGTNVGGLVGNNSGNLTNAYNTTDVNGGDGVTSVGNAVGTNSGTISNIYATNTDGNLIGSGNEINVSGAYSFSANDNDRTNITVLNADDDSDNDGIKDRVDSASYGAFDFDSTDGDKADWKNYDGYGNPLLKVFLTKLTVDADKVDLVYNAGEQDLNIGQLIEDGIITAPEAEALQAHYNTLKNNELGESDLLANTKGQENAGTYDNWLYSGQIADGSQDGSFNPNNLGYDIEYSNTVNPDKPGITIDKANIQISLDNIYHIYGNVNNVYSDSKGETETTYKDSWTIENESDLSQAMKEYIGKNLLVDKNTDEALNGDKTQNVGDDYDWSLTITLGGDKASNYTINDNDVVVSQTISGENKSHVTKADLTITAADKDTTPGVMPNFTGSDIQQGLVNGDIAGDYEFNSDVDVNVAGTYTDKIGISFGDGKLFYDLSGETDWSKVAGWKFLSNYNITFNPGTLTVTDQVLPDLPDNWPSNRWDYLFSDNPFDRNKNFRERKAEVNFVDGGMEI